MSQTNLPDRAAALSLLTAKGAPFELRSLTINGAQVRSFQTGPRSLRELFTEAVSDQTFLVYEGERQTFREAHAGAARIAHLLVHQYGVKKGDRVAISLRNYPEWVLAFMGASSIGAVVVAMNALWPADELEFALTDSGAKVLFADQERLDRLAQFASPPQAAVIAVRPKLKDDPRTLVGLLTGFTGDKMPPAVVAPEDPAIIYFTSGSTGRPKGVVSSHRNVLSALLSWELDARAGVLVSGVEPPAAPYQPATLLAVPLFHVTGSHAVFLQSYRAQRKMVCMYRWDPQAAAELIEKERITSFTAPAAMTGDLVREARQSRRDLSSMAVVGGGGAPRAPEQVRQIESSFAKALPNTGWGMTETNAIGTGIGGPDYLARPESSGRCSAVMDIKIVDEDGLSMPAGRRGELLVRGAALFMGYWNRPEANTTSFVDGWFRTGDVAYLDEEGFLFIVDRIKDVIIRGGENIGCGGVEAALLEHPLIYETAVYGVPDDRLGEEVGTTVYGSPDLDIRELRAFLSGRLARFEAPRYIRTSAQPLPRTASGKVLKRQLREEAVQALAAGAGIDDGSRVSAETTT